VKNQRAVNLNAEFFAPVEADDASIDPVEAPRRGRLAALVELARLGQEIGVGYETDDEPSENPD